MLKLNVNLQAIVEQDSTAYNKTENFMLSGICSRADLSVSRVVEI